MVEVKIYLAQNKSTTRRVYGISIATKYELADDGGYISEQGNFEYVTWLLKQSI